MSRSDNGETHAQGRPCTVGVLVVVCPIVERLDGASFESPEVRPVLVLPVIPHFVDHLHISGVHQPTALVCVEGDVLTAWCIQNNGSDGRHATSVNMKIIKFRGDARAGRTVG